MSKALTKPQIIAALSAETGLSKPDVAKVLTKLMDMAYREAANGFTLPGLCKFKLVRRKESRRYNPVTRARFLIAEHDVLKIIPLKKAREKMAPLPPDLIIRQLPPSEAAASAPPKTAASEPAQTAAPSAAPAAAPSADESGGIIFSCPHCGNTIMAQLNERGQTAECPVCNGQMIVPDGTSAPAGAPADASPAAAKPKSVTNFVTFVCDVCKQEIEAPLEMIGMKAVCPACGSQLKVPAHESEPKSGPASALDTKAKGKIDRSSMTIRMDLSDLS